MRALRVGRESGTAAAATALVLEASVIKPSPAAWLLRIPEVFSESQGEILRELDARLAKKLGREFLLVHLKDTGKLHNSPYAKFVRWNIPVHHSWPCCPKETPGFIEKAAQALFRKFGEANPQTVVVGALDPSASNRYYRTLASNLRGRTLQLFPQEAGRIHDAESQRADLPTLFCLVGKEGLFCGLQSPAASKGFYPGGTKFISQSGNDVISRAGAKVVEALHYLQLRQPPPENGGHWLELGASPGGMTSELLARGYQVTAVDRAPLDKRLDRAPGLQPVIADAASFLPERDVSYDAILCDMNGGAVNSISIIVRLARYLRDGGLVVFTLKTPGAGSLGEINALEAAVVDRAAVAGLILFDQRHLSYNRQEFTLFFRRVTISPSVL